jgi:hypothetical protein
MDNSQRMTIERANKLLDQYGLKLTKGHWTPPFSCRATPETRDNCCPVGLLIIDKDGFNRDEENIIDDLAWSTRNEVWARRDDENPARYADVMNRKIAEYVGLPPDYVFGLNDGFEDHVNPLADRDSDDYKVGYHDGQDLFFASKMTPELIDEVIVRLNDDDIVD